MTSILFVALLKMSQQRQELLLFSILAILALLGLTLLYGELRDAIRTRKSKKEIVPFPDRIERVLKAGQIQIPCHVSPREKRRPTSTGVLDELDWTVSADDPYNDPKS